MKHIENNYLHLIILLIQIYFMGTSILITLNFTNLLTFFFEQAKMIYYKQQWITPHKMRKGRTTQEYLH